MAISIQELVEGDLAAAARRKLLDAFESDDLRRLSEGASRIWLGEGGLIGQDAVGDPYEEGWVFPGLDNEGRPLRAVEGSNKCSITFLNRDHWNTNQHNSMNMPVLRTLIYADTVRDEYGNPAGRIADLRVRKVGQFVGKVFHAPDNYARERALGEQGPDGHLWNVGKSEELYVISCIRSPGGGLNITDVIDNDYAVRGDIRFEVALRD